MFDFDDNLPTIIPYWVFRASIYLIIRIYTNKKITSRGTYVFILVKNKNINLIFS